jgi:hypothetical protein
MIKIKLAVLIIALFNVPAFSSELLNNTDSLKKISDKPLRIYNTSRLNTAKPLIDGVLNDSCWSTGEWASDFTQWIPNEGAKPTYPTWLKILYDDKNIYVAIRAFDGEPQKISRKAARRDDLSGDMVGINFDSYHDHRTGFEFDITAAGQKIDLILTNPMVSDFNWNAVWSAKAGIEDSAWVAEFEIPLSQLRYSNDDNQVWGMHCWRWIDRLQEESDWEPQSLTGPGMLYLFGELHGIEGLPRSRRIEIMPYGSGKLKTFEREADNPFAEKGRSWLGNAGLDAKIGITSNFTADLSINPDFGQVESDPSVMNLTAFETFYEEKRPFFLEGENIFSFDFDDVNLFYSRRIGQSPSYSPDLDSTKHMNYPDNTAILTALKFSGKNSKGLSIGVLQSLTANEHAQIDSASHDLKQDVEPLTNFAIIRLQQDFNQGTTILGGILTSTNRFIKDAQLNFINREAYTGGIDLLHQWHEKEFYIDAKIVGSNIKGHSDAIKELQMSSAHYYQRPGIDYINFDSTLTQLSGYGGKIKIGKGSKGLWRYSTELNWRSPGLDLNDIGFMQTADIIKQVNSLSYFINKPVSIFRTYSIGVSESNHWDFGARYLASGAGLSLYMEFLNKWALNTSLNYTSQMLDTRILRGGYAMLVPANWSDFFYLRTDYSKKLFFDISGNLSASDNKSIRFYSLQPGVSLMVTHTLKISVSVNYDNNFDRLQYVDTKKVQGENVYILGKISQQTLGSTFRIDYNITPELSIQYYGNPFASIGKYSEFKAVTDPESESYSDRYINLNPILNNENEFEILNNINAKADYKFGNPDFNFSQFRSNLVFRWEFRPGSQLYLVWSQDKTNFVQPGIDSIHDALVNIREVYPNNIFLIKFNYWFSI